MRNAQAFWENDNIKIMAKLGNQGSGLPFFGFPVFTTVSVRFSVSLSNRNRKPRLVFGFRFSYKINVFVWKCWITRLFLHDFSTHICRTSFLLSAWYNIYVKLQLQWCLNFLQSSTHCSLFILLHITFITNLGVK